MTTPGLDARASQVAPRSTCMSPVPIILHTKVGLEIVEQSF